MLILQKKNYGINTQKHNGKKPRYKYDKCKGSN